jgi:group II intron reverse transcriptase/maturase
LEKSNKTFQRLERLRQLNTQREWVNEDLYRLLYKTDLYIIAYERIKSKPGNMTPGTDGETLDGFSLDNIQTIIHDMKTEQFQFKAVRTSYIPKTNGKMRKLGIPCVRDKIVQEVMLMVLEAIYDSPDGPYFLDTSHGFRPNRSCHTALREIRGKWAAINWLVEGDITNCFDDIDHATLVKLLRKKIRDERFLNLVWKLLRAGYLNLQGEHQNSLAGTPQGTLISPILSNIYLHELDTKVEELRQTLEKGKKKHRNPLHRKLSARKQRLVRRGQTDTKEYRTLVKQIRQLPAVEVNDPNFIRIKYLRYADDWLIGISGPHALAEHIKATLATFLKDELNLTLNQDKTRVTHAKQEQATFLGTLISIGRGGIQKVVATTNGSGRIIHRRSTGWETVIDAPKQRLINRLHDKGFCTTQGEPTTKLSWINLDADQTVSLFNGINRGIQNYYRFVDNIGSIATLQYILRFSLAKTLAAKYRISVRQVFQRFGNNLTITVKAEDGSSNRQISFYRNTDWEKKRNAFITNNITIDQVQMALRLRSRSKLGKPCCICGSTQQVEMHHVRHIRKIGQKTKGFTTVLQALNRKQIPTCRPCHLKIHRGDYDGLKLSELAYDPC